MRTLMLCVLVLLTGTAFAETLSWEPPTSRMDGTPLDPATELSAYRLTCGETVTEIPAVGDGTNEYPLNKAEVLPGYGNHDCYLTAVDTEGRVSPPSNTVTVLYEKVGPSQPINLIILES